MLLHKHPYPASAEQVAFLTVGGALTCMSDVLARQGKHYRSTQNDGIKQVASQHVPLDRTCTLRRLLLDVKTQMPPPSIVYAIHPQIPEVAMMAAAAFEYPRQMSKAYLTRHQANLQLCALQESSSVDAAAAADVDLLLSWLGCSPTCLQRHVTYGMLLCNMPLQLSWLCMTIKQLQGK